MHYEKPLIYLQCLLRDGLFLGLLGGYETVVKTSQKDDVERPSRNCRVRVVLSLGVGSKEFIAWSLVSGDALFTTLFGLPSGCCVVNDMAIEAVNLPVSCRVIRKYVFNICFSDESDLRGWLKLNSHIAVTPKLFFLVRCGNGEKSTILVYTHLL